METSYEVNVPISDLVCSQAHEPVQGWDGFAENSSFLAFERGQFLKTGSPVFSGKRHRIQPTVICGTLYLV
jgi:hypothetical protein